MKRPTEPHVMFDTTPGGHGDSFKQKIGARSPAALHDNERRSVRRCAARSILPYGIGRWLVAAQVRRSDPYHRGIRLREALHCYTDALNALGVFFEVRCDRSGWRFRHDLGLAVDDNDIVAALSGERFQAFVLFYIAL